MHSEAPALDISSALYSDKIQMRLNRFPFTYGHMCLCAPDYKSGLSPSLFSLHYMQIWMDPLQNNNDLQPGRRSPLRINPCG